MKKYAILIAAFMVIQGAARANHEPNHWSNWSESEYGHFAWGGVPLKADSSIRGAMHLYSTQHLDLNAMSKPAASVGSSQSFIRADSSERGAKMPQEYWDTRPSAEGTSLADLQSPSESVVIDADSPSFETEVQVPAQGTPGDNVQTDSQSSLDESFKDLNTPPPIEDSFEPPISSDLDLDKGQKATDDYDYHPKGSLPDASKSSDYRSESSDALRSSESPDQGAPAISPDTGRASDSEQAPRPKFDTSVYPDLSSSPVGDAASKPNDLLNSQGEATLQDNERLDRTDAAIGPDGATGVQSKDSVDTTVRPEFDPASTQQGTDDVSFSERVRTSLSTGNEGRPSAFTSEMLQDVKINSQNGVVTIHGRVSNEQEKQDLESRVKEMPGVTSVINRIEVSSGENSKLPE